MKPEIPSVKYFIVIIETLKETKVHHYINKKKKIWNKYKNKWLKYQVCVALVLYAQE